MSERVSCFFIDHEYRERSDSGNTNLIFLSLSISHSSYRLSELLLERLIELIELRSDSREIELFIPSSRLSWEEIVHAVDISIHLGDGDS